MTYSQRKPVFSTINSINQIYEVPHSHQDYKEHKVID